MRIDRHELSHCLRQFFRLHARCIAHVPSHHSSRTPRKILHRKETKAHLVWLGVGLDLGDGDTSVRVGVDVDHLILELLRYRFSSLHTLELARPEYLWEWTLRRFPCCQYLPSISIAHSPLFPCTQRCSIFLHIARTHPHISPILSLQPFAHTPSLLAASIALQTGFQHFSRSLGTKKKNSRSPSPWRR